MLFDIREKASIQSIHTEQLRVPNPGGMVTHVLLSSGHAIENDNSTSNVSTMNDSSNNISSYDASNASNSINEDNSTSSNSNCSNINNSSDNSGNASTMIDIATEGGTILRLDIRMLNK